MIVKALLSKATQNSKADNRPASKAMISSLVNAFLHLAIIVDILGGQIQFILLAMSSKATDIFSQFYSLMQNDFLLSLLRYEIARYCVSLVTFLLQARIHLIADFLYQSSMESMELEEELVVSVKLGREVHFCSSLAEATWLHAWNFSCIRSLNSNIEDIYLIFQKLYPSNSCLLFHASLFQINIASQKGTTNTSKRRVIQGQTRSIQYDLEAILDRFSKSDDSLLRFLIISLKCLIKNQTNINTGSSNDFLFFHSTHQLIALLILLVFFSSLSSLPQKHLLTIQPPSLLHALHTLDIRLRRRYHIVYSFQPS